MTDICPYLLGSLGGWGSLRDRGTVPPAAIIRRNPPAVTRLGSERGGKVSPKGWARLVVILSLIGLAITLGLLFGVIR